MDYVRPLAGEPERDVLVKAEKCCTMAKPCSWHTKAFKGAGYHICPLCGAICDCGMEDWGRGPKCVCYNGCHGRGRKKKLSRRIYKAVLM